MRRCSLLIAAVAVAACSDHAAPVQPAPGPSLAAAGPAAEVIPGRFIVVFRGDVQDPPGLARRLVAAGGGTLRFTYEAALKGFAADLPDAAAAALARNPNVAYVEQDQVMRAVTTQTGATWGIDRIDQRALPLSTTYDYTNTGAGVTAYIIDTGIWITHNEIVGRASVGFDAVGDGHNGIDCNGHGTHVSGTVGGTTYGVAKQVSLVAVRVLDCGGSGSNSGVIAGINWVAQNRTLPAVANMSFGGSASQAVDDAVTGMINAGVAAAIAAGNGNFLGIAQNACNYSPARVPAAMTIGATDKTDTKASFSNYGTCVDWFAPGVSITSAWYTSNTATNTISGTSMATPHVAGAAALYLQSNPGASPADVAQALRTNATANVVKSAGTGSPNLLLYTGFIGGGTPVDNPPTVSITSPAAAATVSGNVTVMANASDDHGVTQVEFFVDGTSIGVDNIGSDGWSASWNTSSYANGSTHSLTAVATDTKPQTATSTAVSVTVDNSAPPPPPPPPPPGNSAPTASFTYTCGNSLTCTFDGTASSDPDHDALTYRWDFGDGAISIDAKPVHTFAARTNYTVTLTVTDPSAATGSTSGVVSCNPKKCQ